MEMSLLVMMAMMLISFRTDEKLHTCLYSCLAADHWPPVRGGRQFQTAGAGWRQVANTCATEPPTVASFFGNIIK